jgi:hypothetical protein
MDSTYRPYRPSGLTFKLTVFLLLVQVTEKQEKATPSHFLKFLFASSTNSTFGFAQHTSHRSAKPKEPFLSQQLEEEFGGEPYIEEAVSQFLNDRVK